MESQAHLWACFEAYSELYIVISRRITHGGFMGKPVDEIGNPDLKLSPEFNNPAIKIPDKSESKSKFTEKQAEADIKTNNDQTRLAARSSASDKQTKDQSQPDLPSLYIKSLKTPYNGLIRHRLIIGSCILLSLAILVLSTLDLKPLIKVSATLDKSFHIQYQEQDKKSQLAPNLSYLDNHSFSEGLLPVSEFTGIAERYYSYGFVDQSGKIVIKPQFIEVSDFHDGLAAVVVNPGNPQLWGYINKSGKLVIKPQFDQAADFYNGSAAVEVKGVGGLIDKNGNFLVRTTEAPTRMGNFYYAKHLDDDKKVGLLDTKGHWVIPPKFSEIEQFGKSVLKVRHLQAVQFNIQEAVPDLNDQYFKAKKDGVWGVIDSSGKTIIAPQYQHILSFNKGHAAVQVDDKYGFADLNGKIVIKPEFDYVTKFAEIIACRKNGKWCFINPQEGKILQTPPLDAVICQKSGQWLTNGLGAVISKDLCGFINIKGELAIKPQYDFVLPFQEGYAAVLKDNSWRYIDTKGHYASLAKFATASSFFKGKASVTIPGLLYSFIEAKTIDQVIEATKRKKKSYISGEFLRE